MKRKIVDPSTGKEIWVLVDENGNILESNVEPPESEIDNAKKTLDSNTISLLEQKIANMEKANSMEISAIKEQNEKLLNLITQLTQQQQQQVQPTDANIIPQTQQNAKPEKQELSKQDADAILREKNLLNKIELLEKANKMAEDREWIGAQVQAKPYMKDLISKLNITTKEDYIKICMPLEEREESVYKAQKQIEKNHTKDIINEYGITVGSASTKNEKLIKAAKEATDIADDLFKEWGLI